MDEDTLERALDGGRGGDGGEGELKKSPKPNQAPDFLALLSNCFLEVARNKSPS